MGRLDTQQCSPNITICIHNRPLAHESNYVATSVLPPSEPLRLARSLHVHTRRPDTTIAATRLLPANTAPSRVATLRPAKKGSGVPARSTFYRPRRLTGEIPRRQGRSILHTYPQISARETLDTGGVCMVFLYGCVFWWEVDKIWIVKSWR